MMTSFMVAMAMTPLMAGMVPITVILAIISFMATIPSMVVGSDAAAATSSADIVYSSATDKLFYNQNGAVAGLGTGAQFSTLTGITSLAAGDFLIQA